MIEIKRCYCCCGSYLEVIDLDYFIFNGFTSYERLSEKVQMKMKIDNNNIQKSFITTQIKFS